MSTVEIYTKFGCPFCVRARHQLNAKGVAFTEHDITFDAAKKVEMVSRSGRRTVPQIFVGDTHIGGSDDLILAEQSGLLDRLLSSGSASVA